jgi:hypothetical protein
VSVATAVTTNIRLKEIMNSSAKAWPYDPDGTVTPPCMYGWNIPFSANDAQIDATTWAVMYKGTCEFTGSHGSINFDRVTI